jgi:hypothetical protein
MDAAREEEEELEAAAAPAAAAAGGLGGDVAAVDGRTSTTVLGVTALPTTNVNTFSGLFC